MEKPYTDDLVVKPKEILGSWKPVVLYGESVKKEIGNWEVKGHKMITTDEKNIKSSIETVYFRINDTLFMSSFPKKPKKENSLWAFHVTPVYLLTRVEISKNKLTFIPLNYKWFKKQIKSKNFL